MHCNINQTNVPSTDALSAYTVQVKKTAAFYFCSNYVKLGLT